MRIQQNASIRVVLFLVLMLFQINTMGQQSIVVNLAPIDGLPITPRNVLNYQIISSVSSPVTIQGSIRYRNSNMSINYTIDYRLKQGINKPGSENLHPVWNFSSPALQELFFNYNVFPEGTFEYCITITPKSSTQEQTNGVTNECLYYKSEDIFLINLISPENKAKLQEYNPLLAWVANYTFSNDLTYRIKVAEIKKGQNVSNAILRNQPVFEENGLMQNSIIYPSYARALVTNQPYAWTVDAFYKGLLLGSAETWQFIIPDTIPEKKTISRSYVEINREYGTGRLSAIGTLKLKYILEDYQSDLLSLELYDDEDHVCTLKSSTIAAIYGDNRYDIDLVKSSNLKHESVYKLIINTKTRRQFKLMFQYFNPEYVK